MPLETSDLHPEPVPPAHPPPPNVPDQANGGYPHNPDLYASIRSNKSQMAAAIRSSNRRVEEKHHPEGHSTLVELLTETSQASVHDILNDGEEDQMFVTGYEKSSVRTFFCYVGFVLTLGIMRLVMHWWQHWLLLATHRKCSLEVAQKVLVHERYQDKHDAYYVKNVITMNAEAIR